MELTDAKCPNCGSIIKINREEKTGVCTHCNSSFFIEDAIKNYITNNSYNIEHATIIKGDFGDDTLFNEVDKYLALCKLDDYERLPIIISKLKEQFPHKGIARIVILNYQFNSLFKKIGGKEIFLNELEDIENRNNSYNPKSYKDDPPTTKFLEDILDIIENRYAENIDKLITNSEKEKYANLVNETIEYIICYNKICEFNGKIISKFEPFEDKKAKILQKQEKKLYKKQNNKLNKSKIIIPFCIFLAAIVAIMCFIAYYLSNYYITNKPTEYLYSLDQLDAPLQVTTELAGTDQVINKNATITYVSEYTLYGRVVGIKKFLPFTAENKTISAILFVTWGELTSEEKSSQINWEYFNNGDIEYTYNNSLGSSEYIKQNSSNNSLIPSNSYIAKYIKNIKKNDLIKIKGYLVNLEFQDSNNIYSYNTSTSLNDNMREIIYVTNVTWLI